jgi:phage-related minor tail protein
MADETISLGADISPLNGALDSAAKALSDFANEPVADTGARIETAINRSFNSVANTISRAAVSGKLSMDKMVTAILADLERVAISQFIVKPIEGVVSNIASSLLNIGGARASGGPVAADVPYLVGEQGPELFVPSSNGSIAPNSALQTARPQIVLNVQARDAASFFKSEPQLAAMMSRALARGQRNL